MRLGFLLASGAAALKGAQHLREVTKMLQAALDDVVDAGKQKQKELTSMKCLDKNLTKRNQQHVEELEERNSDLNVSLQSLSSVTLTDEGKILREKIAAKDKDIEAHQDDMDKKQQEHDDHQADLKAGINSLAKAKRSVAPNSSMGSRRVLAEIGGGLGKVLLRSQKLAKALHELTRQAPEQYETHLGPIISLIDNLLLELKTEESDVEAEWEKTKTAMQNMLKQLKGERKALQDEASTGAGEAAAKLARENELKDELQQNNDLIDQLNLETTTSNDEKTKAEGEYMTFEKENLETQRALEEAIGYLDDPDNRDLFTKVAKKQLSFLQRSSVAGSNAAFNEVIQMVKKIRGELDGEKTKIDTNMKSCHKKSKDSIRASLQTSERMDSLMASIVEETEEIRKQNEQQEDIRKQMDETAKMLADAKKSWEERDGELEKTINDLFDALGVVDSAAVALKDKVPTIKNMLKNIITDMTREYDDNKHEKKTAKEQFEALETRTGYETEEDAPACSGDTVMCKFEKQYAASEKAESDASDRKLDAETDHAAALRTLNSGKTDFNGRQADCDDWMVNGPGRKSDIENEITAMNQAVNVMENLDIDNVGSSANAGFGSVN